MTADIKLQQMRYTCLLKRKKKPPTLCSLQSKRCILSEVQKYFFFKEGFLLGSLISQFLMCSLLPLLLQSWLMRRDLC